MEIFKGLKYYYGLTTIAFSMLITVLFPFTIFSLPLTIASYSFKKNYQLFILSILIGQLLSILPLNARDESKQIYLNQPYTINTITATVKDDSRMDYSGNFKTTLILRHAKSYYVTTEARGSIVLYTKLDHQLYKGEKITAHGLFKGEKNNFFSRDNDIKREGFSHSVWEKRLLVKKKFTTHSQSRLGKAFGLFTAITTGDRNHLDPITEHLFRQTGLNHLLVLSGYHVGLLLTLILFILHSQGSRRALIMAIPFLLIYLVLSGIQYSLSRAVIMAVMMAISSYFYRRVQPMHLLSFSFIIIIVVDPIAIDSLSFQLSFLAMLGLILIQPPITRVMLKLPYYLRIATLSQSFAAQLATSPLLLYRFKNIFPVAIFLGFLSTILVTSYITLCLFTITWPFTRGLTFLLYLVETYNYIILRLLYYISFFPQIKLY